MGAEYFTHTAKGASASAAFDQAVTDAHYDYGHAGYTGTIAEKDGFVLYEPLPGITYAELAHVADLATDASYGVNTEAARAEVLRMFGPRQGDDLINRADGDKWGPACAVRVGVDEYLFFGYAST